MFASNVRLPHAETEMAQIHAAIAVNRWPERLVAKLNSTVV